MVLLKTLTDERCLYNRSLSSCALSTSVALAFQSVSGHAGLPENVCQLTPAIAEKQGYPKHFLKKKYFNSICYQIPKAIVTTFYVLLSL